MSRYVVAVVRGYSFTADQRRGRAKEGLTASVLDTVAYHREVKRFRSDGSFGPPRNRGLGTEGAIAAAEQHAAALNAEHEAA